MNIITVMSDEHSYQMMQFIDHSILKTPNLDRLAAESAVFDNCYSPCPVCAPARASFISGRYVSRLGTWDNSTPYDGTVPGLSHCLAQNHIPYISIGKTHFHPDGNYAFAHQEFPGWLSRPDIGCFFRDQKRGRIGAKQRFENIGLKTGESHDDRVLASALTWLEKHGQEENWYLYVGFLDPHFPFYVKKEHWDYFERQISQIPKELKPPFTSLNEPLSWLRTYFQCEDVPEETVRRLLIGYHCAVAELDERIGILLDMIDRLGLRDKTVFCYTSDHGEQLGYHGLWWKCCMFEQSAHIPMIVRVPGQRPRRIKEPVSLVDWFPTVCDLLGISSPKDLDGQSLLPFIETGKSSTHQDFSFSEYSAHGIPNSMFMIRWRQYKYVYFCYNAPQLFNLETDPAENHSLLDSSSADPAAIAAAEECRQRLFSVCDPYEVDARAKNFQRRTKKALGITEYTSDMIHCPVPHPESAL